MTMFRKFSPMQFSASNSWSNRSALARIFSVGPVMLLCVAALCAVGCSTTSRDYPGVSRDDLWQATLLAARNPKYSDWFVTSNGVMVDEADDRIEVYRELKRDHAPPGGALRRESETWTFSIRVDTSDRIPKVSLDTRSKIRTAAFWKQADHLFGEIDARLAQLPSESARAKSLAHPTSHDDLEIPMALETAPRGELVVPVAENPAALEPLSVP